MGKTTLKKKYEGTTRRPKSKGLQLDPHQVIVKPMVTEKGVLQSNMFNQYTFQVSPFATKTQIKEAVEKLFEVKVEKVATQNRKGKPRRYRFTHGTTKGFKKAIVKLKPDHQINFF